MQSLLDAYKIGSRVRAALIFLAISTAASAQGFSLPQTVPWTDRDGKPIGTATIFGLHMYLRDLNGELVATVVVERDGTKTLYDPHGKVLDKVPGKIPE